MTEVSNGRGRRVWGEPLGSPHARALRCQRGFTLVETLIGMVMALTLLLASFPLIDGAANTQGRIENAALSVSDARTFSDAILRDVRPATRILVPALGGTASTLTVETYVRRTNCVSGVLSAPGADPYPCRVTYSCSGPAGNVDCTRTESECKAPFAAGAAETEVRGLSNPDIFTVEKAANLDNPDFVDIKLAIADPKNPGKDLIELEDGTTTRNLGLTNSAVCS